MQLVEKLGAYVRSNIENFNPWGNYLALCRSAVAIGTLLTLLFNNTEVLFRPVAGSSEVPSCLGLTKLSIYCFLNSDIELARWLSIFILIVTLTGIYPRITSLFHWWVTFSFVSSATIVDGGDQVASVLTLLLLPICLMDKRKNHWLTHSATSDLQKLISLSTLIVIKIQVSYIYLQAFVSKLNVAEWVDGTASYYWFIDPMFGVTANVRPYLIAILSKPIPIVILTWGALLIEFSLFLTIMLRKKHPLKMYFLILGISFHFAIVIIHGLASFFFSMTAALIIYLMPTDYAFKNYLNPLMVIFTRKKK